MIDTFHAVPQAATFYPRGIISIIVPEERRRISCAVLSKKQKDDLKIEQCKLNTCRISQLTKGAVRFRVERNVVARL
ncbi:hypothetical protein KM043_016648 [Ampulex compressa]|nr:hypothetical protein KM043_016648 [Ampulex compressa]